MPGFPFSPLRPVRPVSRKWGGGTEVLFRIKSWKFHFYVLQQFFSGEGSEVGLGLQVSWDFRLDSDMVSLCKATL